MMNKQRGHFMKIKKFFIFFFHNYMSFFVLPAVQTMIQKRNQKKPSLEVITIFFRTTFKPFLSICDFIGFFYTFNFFYYFLCYNLYSDSSDIYYWRYFYGFFPYKIYS